MSNTNPRNDRDKDGFRIPREGTLSFSIYYLSKHGMSPADIALSLGVTPTTVRVLMHRYKHPDLSNKRANSFYHKTKKAAVA